MPNLPRCVPGDVDGGIGILPAWPEDLKVVDYGLFGQVKVHALLVFSNGFIRYLHDPEQTGLRNVPVVIVDLCSRTGIVKVNSYEHEGTTMVSAVGRDVLAAVETHV